MQYFETTLDSSAMVWYSAKKITKQKNRFSTCRSHSTKVNFYRLKVGIYRKKDNKVKQMVGNFNYLGVQIPFFSFSFSGITVPGGDI